MSIYQAKRCSRCKAEKSPTDFQRNRSRADGLQVTCRDCSNARSLAWAANNKDRVRHANRNGHLLKAYGLSSDDYSAMASQQGHVCAICCQPNGSEALFVDHDHRTGAIRQLLCRFCNSALGMMRDSPDRLRAAARYLELHDPAYQESTDGQG